MPRINHIIHALTFLKQHGKTIGRQQGEGHPQASALVEAYRLYSTDASPVRTAQVIQAVNVYIETEASYVQTAKQEDTLV